MTNENEIISKLNQFVKEKFPQDDVWIMAQILNDLKTQSCEQYYNKVITGQIGLGWYHESFNDFRLKELEQDSFIQKPMEIEEGVIQCKKCKSFKVYSFSQQVRSADEPATVFAHCAICFSKWSE